jgi:hypothetical protein
VSVEYTTNGVDVMSDSGVLVQCGARVDWLANSLVVVGDEKSFIGELKTVVVSRSDFNAPMLVKGIYFSLLPLSPKNGVCD